MLLHCLSPCHFWMGTKAATHVGSLPQDISGLPGVGWGADFHASLGSISAHWHLKQPGAVLRNGISQQQLPGCQSCPGLGCNFPIVLLSTSVCLLRGRVCQHFPAKCVFRRVHPWVGHHSPECTWDLFATHLSLLSMNDGTSCSSSGCACLGSVSGQQKYHQIM